MSENKHGIRALQQGRSDVFQIAPDKLKIADSWNKRNFADPDNAEHVEALSRSIAMVGVRQPLTGYYEDGFVVVTDGECRYRATMLAIERGAEIKTVPVRTEDRFSNEVDHLYSQEIRNSGKRFKPAERAELFKHLLDLGQTESDIAAKCGLTREYVVNILKMRMAAPEIRDALTTGMVSGTLVMEAQRNGSEAEKALAESIAEAKASGKAKLTRKDVAPRAKKPSVAEIHAAIKHFLSCAIENHDGSLVFDTEDVNDLKKSIGYK